MAEFQSSRAEILDVPLRTTLTGQSTPAEAQLDYLVNLLAAERTSSQSGELCESETGECKLSIVMPCLNEAETIGNCILEALYAIDRIGVRGEVIVADNGSRDDSVEIAEALGARVVHVDEPGYGAAVDAGIQAASGEFVVIGDADSSCDFAQTQRFYVKLIDGADLVQGCRLPSGGGKIMPGAMSRFRKLANPALGWLVRRRFGGKLRDIDCGMRAIRKSHYQQLNPTCTGSEYAIEMVIKSIQSDANMCEVPIRLHARPDGTRSRRIRTASFVWRVLRMCFSFSPLSSR